KWLDTIYIAVILLQGTYTPLVYAHDGRTQWQTQCQKLYAPNHFCLAINDEQTDLPEGLAERRPGNSTIAYICSGFQCSIPITSQQDLISALSP
ncbi:MAG: hypothetical protein KZQ57_08235, partial [gamma proteobacterium symbiont of Lucinoma myriamae]|nr:hypothetical protein [gamma proteobacterium symbiont of Lucinoma myriamae]